MGVVHNPIIVEDRFQEIFNYIPDMKFDVTKPAYPIKFAYGDEDELMIYLKTRETESVRPYPLIWLVYPLNEKHLKTRVELRSASLILAVDTTKAGLNTERIKLNYKTILIPLYGNIVKALTRANIVNLKHEFDIIKFPNYSQENTNGTLAKTISRWDALKVTFSCQIIDTCLKPIKI
jgi:hypothetical protein